MIRIKTAAAVLIFITAALIFSACTNKETPSAENTVSSASDTVSTSDETAVSETEIIEDIRWAGWQKAKTEVKVPLYAEKDLYAEAVYEIPSATDCVITQRENDLVYVRSLKYEGWADIALLTVESEPYIADTCVSGADISPLPSEHSEKIEKIAKKYKATGLTLAVIDDGEVVYTYEYGYANKKSRKKMTADTKIRIASVSKVFTMMNVMTARDLGALSLDDDIGEILGYKVRNRNYPDTKITMRHLMTHTSSMKDLLDYSKVKEGLTSKSTYLKVKPGTAKAWEYNNFSAGIMGAVAEKALNENLVDFSKRYYLDRMNIDAAFRARCIKDQDKIADLYMGEKLYRTVKTQVGRTYSKTPGNNYIPYFGSLTISSKDMASLVTILINDGQYKGEYYMSPESVAEMEQVCFEFEDFDQCGILRRQTDMYDGRTLYYHTGNAQGVRAFMSYDSESGDGMVVTVTGMDSNSKDKKGIYKVCGETANYCYSVILKEESQ